jgi:hypothetical protein
MEKTKRLFWEERTAWKGEKRVGDQNRRREGHVKIAAAASFIA